MYHSPISTLSLGYRARRPSETSASRTVRAAAGKPLVTVAALCAALAFANAAHAQSNDNPPPTVISTGDGTLGTTPPDPDPGVITTGDGTLLLSGPVAASWARAAQVDVAGLHGSNVPGAAHQLSPVAAVPEPSTWAMTLGGMSVMAWLTRRRARRSEDV